MKKKTLTIAIALVLVVALAVGATYAYLMAETKAVTNTFTAGSVIDNKDFLLQEHKVAYDNASGTYKYVDQQGAFVETGTVVIDGNKYEQIAPKTTAPKDPYIQFNAEVKSPAYLFVKVTDTTTGITAKVDNANWIELTGADLKLNANEKLYVYKDIITVGTHNDLYYILKGNQITASETGTIGGSLVFNGYLCQSAGFDTPAAAFTACFGA